MWMHNVYYYCLSADCRYFSIFNLSKISKFYFYTQFKNDNIQILNNKHIFLNTASVKSACAMSTCFFTYSSIIEHFTSIVGLEENKSYNRQSLQLKNNGFWV